MSADTRPQKAGQVAKGTDATGAPHDLLVNPDGSLAVAGVGGVGAAIPTAPGAKPSTATASPALFTNIGANATLNIKASGGNVFALACTNANAATRYFQLHNTATFPADQAVPLYVFPLISGGGTVIGEDFFSQAGANFATGIAFAVSTTPKTFTAATAGDHVTAVHYK